MTWFRIPQERWLRFSWLRFRAYICLYWVQSKLNEKQKRLPNAKSLSLILFCRFAACQNFIFCGIQMLKTEIEYLFKLSKFLFYQRTLINSVKTYFQGLVAVLIQHYHMNLNPIKLKKGGLNRTLATETSWGFTLCLVNPPICVFIMKAQTKQTSKDNMFQSCPHFCNIQVGIMSCIHVGINTGYLMCSDRVRGFLLFAWGVNVSLASQKQLSKECQ